MKQIILISINAILALILCTMLIFNRACGTDYEVGLVIGILTITTTLIVYIMTREMRESISFEEFE